MHCPASTGATAQLRDPLRGTKALVMAMSDSAMSRADAPDEVQMAKLAVRGHAAKSGVELASEPRAASAIEAELAEKADVQEAIAPHRMRPIETELTLGIGGCTEAEMRPMGGAESLAQAEEGCASLDCLDDDCLDALIAYAMCPADLLLIGRVIWEACDLLGPRFRQQSPSLMRSVDQQPYGGGGTAREGGMASERSIGTPRQEDDAWQLCTIDDYCTLQCGVEHGQSGHRTVRRFALASVSKRCRAACRRRTASLWLSEAVSQH